MLTFTIHDDDGHGGLGQPWPHATDKPIPTDAPTVAAAFVRGALRDLMPLRAADGYVEGSRVHAAIHDDAEYGHWIGTVTRTLGAEDLA